MAHRRDDPPLLILGALAAVCATGAAWWRDAQERNRRAAVLHRTMVELLLNTLCAGDPVTARHSRRVADLTDALSAPYHLRRDARARLRVASLLHDLGKLEDGLFPIVHSDHRLSDNERDQVNRHPGEGADILKPLEALHPGITLIVESHHERWDGCGYPRGLAGTEIPLEARIITVADFFDALTQPRSYREPLSVPDTLEEIRCEAGTKFDPEVVARLEEDGVLRRWTQIAEEGRRLESRAETLDEVDLSCRGGAQLASARLATGKAPRAARSRTES